MKTIFHPEAEEEFIAAVRQYSDIDLSLGAVMHFHARPGYWKERMKDSPVRQRRTGRKSVKRQ